MALETDFHPSIGVDDDGNGVGVVQGLIKGFLGLVNPAFFVNDTLPTPRVAQPVAGRSNRQGINDGYVGHANLLNFTGLTGLWRGLLEPFYNQGRGMSLGW